MVNHLRSSKILFLSRIDKKGKKFTPIASTIVYCKRGIYTMFLPGISGEQIKFYSR